jgi:acyl-CoA synthetase (AMP-forming)/AMP-acid ligase II
VVGGVDAAALEQNQIRIGEKAIVGCGQPLPGQTVKIVNPETLAVCQPDQVGEIWVISPSVTQGYWQRQTETEEAFQARLAGFDQPFFRTGDLGFLHQGELFITGRLKDVMIIRGQNHYPQDIELTTERSHPMLRPGGGAAFTLEADGQEQLVVVQEVERTAIHKLEMPEVAGCVSQAIAAEHGLQVAAIVLIKPGSLPRTSSGKTQRRACRQQFVAGELAIVDRWSRTPIP